jgi:hypothetical protein
VLGSGDVCYITIDLVQEAGYSTAKWNVCQQGHYVQPNAHLRLISNLTECLFEHMVSVHGSSAIPLEAFSFKTLTNIFPCAVLHTSFLFKLLVVNFYLQI